MLSSKLLLRDACAFFVAALLSGLCWGENSSTASLEINNSQYLRSNEMYFRDGASGQATSWRFGWKAQGQKKSWLGKIDFRNDYVAEEDFHYLKPFEIYGGWQKDQLRFTIGREKRTWSEADEFWRLGVYQPRFQEDWLDRQTAGLTGGFAVWQGDKAEITTFASPIWIPDIGPHFDLKNENFYSASPWFHPPTPSVYLENNLTNIHYRFKSPDVTSMISHGMGGAQFVYKSNDSLQWRLTGMYKPMNQLLIGFPISLRLQDPNYADVDVKTRLIYQQLITLEGVYRDDSWASWWSLTSDTPIRDNPPAEWTTQEVKPAVIGSFMFGKDVRGSGVNATHVYASYLRVEGGTAPDRGEIIGSQSFFESRYIFQDALMIGARHTMPWFGSKFLTRLNLNSTYDFAQHGILMSLQLQQPISKYWSMNFSGDAIGLLDRDGRVQNGFFSTYRANDRLSLGVRYVF